MISGWPLALSALRSATPQTFRQAVYFTVNESHRMKFLVFAEAVPIDLAISHSDLQFRFPDFGFEPSVTLPVTLTNQGNSDADFNWQLPEEASGAPTRAEGSTRAPACSGAQGRCPRLPRR